MAFLKFMKKREGLLSDIDLDMPPEPPKMFEEGISIEEPIDEELMPSPRIKPKKLKTKEEELPELPPLPEMEEEMPPLPEEEELGPLPELPPLTEEPSKEFEEWLELPPPPQFGKKKKGFFSFLKPKKKVEELELPKLEETLEMPPLPSVEEEFPEIPPLLEEEKISLPEEKPIIAPTEPLKPVTKEGIKEVEKPVKKKFITIDDFRQIQADISNAKSILKDVGDLFDRLEEVKSSGDKEYFGLYHNLKDIQAKIMFVDRVLFKEV